MAGFFAGLLAIVIFGVFKMDAVVGVSVTAASVLFGVFILVFAAAMVVYAAQDDGS